jgi:hypothetical protein
VDGRKFEAIVTIPEKRPERAWAVVEKAVDLVLNRFSAIEMDIEKNLATRLVMWNLQQHPVDAPDPAT